MLFAAAVMIAALSWAEPVSQLHPTDYVNDFAHVLSPQTIAELDDIAQQVDQKAHAQIAVATINTLDGGDIDSYASDLFKRWGVGNKSTNRGVLILIAVKDHRYRTEVGYGLEPILPDGKVGGIWREAVPLLKQNNYSEAVRFVTEQVASVIAQDAGAQLTGQTAQPERRPGPTPHISLRAVILFIIVVIIVLATPLRRVLFWFLLFNSGFGGFGGGSSGGGGASGSW
jgi:uncharacterized protein